MITVLTLPATSAYRWGASGTGGGPVTPTSTATYMPTYHARRR